MKKILLFALAVLALTSCTKQHPFNPKAIAEQCLYDHAVHPEHLKVISCSATLNADTTIVNTEYHIAAVDGTPLNDRYWNNVTAVYTDSVRISHFDKPEHYYCYATVECMNDCGEIVKGFGEVAVFPDGSAMMYDTYRNRYAPFIDTTYAQRDTITDVHDVIGYLPEWNGWVVQQLILNRRNSSLLE